MTTTNTWTGFQYVTYKIRQNCIDIFRQDNTCKIRQNNADIFRHVNGECIDGLTDKNRQTNAYKIRQNGLTYF